MAKRLSIALILSIILGFGCYVILPRYGVTLPPWVPVLAFAFMLVASVAVELERDSEHEQEEQDVCGGDPGDRVHTGDGCDERRTCPTHPHDNARPIDRAGQRARESALRSVVASRCVQDAESESAKPRISPIDP